MPLTEEEKKKIIDEIWTKEEMEEYLKEVSQRRKEKNRKIYQKRKQKKKDMEVKNVPTEEEIRKQQRKEKNRKVYQKRKQEKKEKKDMIEKNRRIHSVKELMCCGGYGLHKIDVLLIEFRSKKFKN